ncbi:MAG: glycoside hydrolase family 27 protein [Oscillospiraceae bacterium]
MKKYVPAMGWNSWNTFAENINEALIMESADALVDNGLLALGYDYLVIDDCWSLKQRDATGRLVPDGEKFPHGMKYVADYVHSKGLKFGMYSCAGNLTCAGYPASFEHEFIDAETFAQWGVDFLKYDYCHKPLGVPGDVLYKTMGNALKTSGREILYNACNWGADKSYGWMKSAGVNSWRSTGDIVDAWKSISHIAEEQIPLQPYFAPGIFNDMDMLVVGMNGKGHVGLTGCSFVEYRTHFSLWALLSSPLFIGCDIRSLSEESKTILTNRQVIAINQDEGAAQPYLAGDHPWPSENVDYVWVKPLDNGDLAIGLFNFGDVESKVKFSLFDLGLGRSTGKTLQLRNLWTDAVERVENEVYVGTIKPHDCQLFRGSIVHA